MRSFFGAFVAFTVITVSLLFSIKAAPYSSPASTCSAKALRVLSCSADALTTDSCCVENPGGLLLQTQLYNWIPGLGSDQSWTIHGLWGDFCNGSYPASCDPSRAYDNIPSILQAFKEYEILDFMTEYWRNDPPITTENGTDADLWAHEWSKHGTCMSTLRPQCYDDYDTSQELVDFYRTTIRMYRSLPTFDFLAACGIVPTNDTTYALADLEGCLADAAGGSVPHVGCSNVGYLNEVWYYYHLRGRISDGIFEGTNSTYKSNCPNTGIKYPPKLSLSDSGF